MLTFDLYFLHDCKTDKNKNKKIDWYFSIGYAANKTKAKNVGGIKSGKQNLVILH